MSGAPIPSAAVPPSVVILGSDALITALPATPTQLANACYAAGFEGVFPASWGDELVAAGCLKNLETRIGPAILCACPLVSEQLRGVAPLQRYQLHLVSPPVAAARYLRALCDDAPLRITYVGDCPGADDASIDERVSPSEFLRRMAQRGITASSQRPDLGANVPRDRRRFYSLPGGAPTPEWLSADWPKRTLVEADAGEALADLAHHALARESTLIDFAPQLGCACSGAVGGIAPTAARRAVAALEPPRARQEVLDPDLKIAVEAPVALLPGREEVTWDEFLASLPHALSAAPEVETAAPAAPPAAAPPSQRRSRESTVVPRGSGSQRVTRRRPGAPEPAEQAQVDVSAEPLRPAARASTGTAMIMTPTGSAAVRPSQAVPRRSSIVEGVSGPRYMAPRAALTGADRWMLVAVVIVCSVLSSALTSVLTMRALRDRSTGTGTKSAVAPPASPAAAIVAMPKDSATAEHPDSLVTAAAPPIPATPVKPAPKPAPKVAPARTLVANAPPPVRRTTPPVVNAARPSAPPVPAPVQASTAAPTVAVPAVAAPAAVPSPDIGAELRAIRDELAARKRRIDSLTTSLDSLKTPAPAADTAKAAAAPPTAPPPL